MNKVEDRLKVLDITLPSAPVPVANYVPCVVSGKLAFVSGQLPVENGALQYIGVVGKNITVEQATEAARLCGLNILAQLKQTIGNLDKVSRCVKLGVFINAIQDFADHPTIANGVSNLMVDVFEDAGKHTRAAVGSGSLPKNVSVEVDAIFEII